MLLFSLLSCHTRQVSTLEELNNYVISEENGLIKHKEVRGYKFTLIYKPPESFIFQEFGENAPISLQEVEEVKSKYGAHHYFILEISKDNREVEYSFSDNHRFSEVLNTLSFRMDDKAYITTSSLDTIPTSDFIYSRTFGLGTGSTLMFAFNKDKTNDAEKLSFHLKDFGLSTGLVKFDIRKADIDKIPKMYIQGLN